MYSETSDSKFTPEWLNREFKPLVIAAKKRNVDPKNLVRFSEFLKNSKDHRLNWAPSTVRAFAAWAGEEYDNFVDDVSSL